MTLKSLLTVAGLSSSAVAEFSRGGHDMTGAGAEEGETPMDDVLYDNGGGNGGEDVNGY